MRFKLKVWTEKYKPLTEKWKKHDMTAKISLFLKHSQYVQIWFLF